MTASAVTAADLAGERESSAWTIVQIAYNFAPWTARRDRSRSGFPRCAVHSRRSLASDRRSARWAGRCSPRPRPQVTVPAAVGAVARGRGPLVAAGIVLMPTGGPTVAPSNPSVEVR
jgi:hypothetical protein